VNSLRLDQIEVQEDSPESTELATWTGEPPLALNNFPPAGDLLFPP